MTGFHWLILNAVLIVATAIGTVKVFTAKPPAPLPASRLEAKEAPATAAEKNAQKPQEAENTAHPDALPASASLEDLWRESLFMPTRAEAEPGDAEAEAAAAAAALAGQNFEFELVGIAQISPVGSYPTPVAVLRSKQQAARRRTNTAQPRRPQGGNQPQQAQKTEENTQPEKLIFKEGDPINKTGYILKAIYPSQKMVEVVRGSETIKLYINYAGADATKRRDDAVQAAAARQKERQAEEDQRQASIRQRNAQQEQEAQRREEERAADNPGLPPPPPGMDDAMPLANTTNAATNAANAPAGAPTDRSEQIRNQVEQNVRQQNNTAPRRRRPGADTTPRLSPNAPTR